MKDVFMTAVCTKDLAGYNVTNLWKTTYDLRGVERSTMTTFLETGGCRSQRPVWNPARGVLVHIHLSVQFGDNSTNQRKDRTRVRKPTTRKTPGAARRSSPRSGGKCPLPRSTKKVTSLPSCSPTKGIPIRSIGDQKPSES